MNKAPVKGILSYKKNKWNFEKDEASANCKRETCYNQGYGNRRRWGENIMEQDTISLLERLERGSETKRVISILLFCIET